VQHDSAALNMKLHNMLPFRRAVLGFLALAALAEGLSQEYCSSENTGSGYSAGTGK
jgi:cell wall integrity and stress response component